MNRSVRRFALFVVAGLALALIAVPPAALIASGLLMPHALASAGLAVVAARLLT